MKITEETKIKDLIRDDWEFDEDKFHQETTMCNGLGIIKIPIKRKRVKNFEYYVNEYNKVLTKFISQTVLHGMRNDVLSKSIDIPFWYKIGILKFICDDLGINCIKISPAIEMFLKDNELMNNYTLIKICPKEFLESIFK